MTVDFDWISTWQNSLQYSKAAEMMNVSDAWWFWFRAINEIGDYTDSDTVFGKFN